jgi:uncharacterized protein YndB with AHSA1/START domain
MPLTGTLKVTTPSDREIDLSRMFDAPRHLVFECLYRPELLKRWLGVHGAWSWKVCDIDFRVGGRYRYVWQGPGGMEMGMGGVYQEIVAPERIVATETFDNPWYEGSGLASYLLTEQGDTTLLTIRIRYDSKEIRDGVLQSPMEQGVGIGYQKLAELLDTLKAGTH